MALGVIGSYGRNKSNKYGEFSSGTLCSRASEGGTDYSATKICTVGSRPSFCIWKTLWNLRVFNYRNVKMEQQENRTKKQRENWSLRILWIEYIFYNTIQRSLTPIYTFQRREIASDELVTASHVS